MIADSMGTAVTKGKIQRQGYYADGTKDPDAVCNKGYLLDPPRLTNESDRADVELPANYHSGPATRGTWGRRTWCSVTATWRA